MARVEIAELGLAALDALDVDAVAVLVGPERPLQGLAGFVDWRLCGALSRAIRAGDYGPESGEALLLPTGGRMAAPRVFCFGLPESPVETATGLVVACRRVAEAMAKAGSAAYASALPPHRADAAPAAARAWLEAAARFPVPRLVLLGDPATLMRELGAARAALDVNFDLVPPTVRVELPGRRAGLSPPGPVVR